MNFSSASLTSVLCKWRISIETLSKQLAITPKTEKYIACLSRGDIWVEIVSGCNFIFFATYLSTLGSILANVPTAPEILHVEISLQAKASLSLHLLIQ